MVVINKKRVAKKGSSVSSLSDTEIIARIKKMRKTPGYYDDVMKEVSIINELWDPFILPNPRGVERK